MKNRLIVIATEDLATRFPGYQATTDPSSIPAAEVKALLDDADTEVAFFSGLALVTNSIPIRVIRQGGWNIGSYSNRSLGELDSAAEVLLLVCGFDLNTSPDDWNWTSSMVRSPAAAN